MEVKVRTARLGRTVSKDL